MDSKYIYVKNPILPQFLQLESYDLHLHTYLIENTKQKK